MNNWKNNKRGLKHARCASAGYGTVADIVVLLSKKPAAIPPPRNVLVLGSMRPVEEGHTQGDIFKLLIRLIQRQLQERNFLQRCGDEVPKAATNPEKFHSLHYPGRSLETLFRMDFDRIWAP